ncbi:MAG: hypothetical protein FJ267_01440, partial [Planctomycetes bacterium]|nr:hypothetical protein [Planctomycetota bacterium]
VVQTGVLGDIKLIVYRWHNPRPFNIPFTWRDDASVSSAGSVADVGSHAYDTLRWMAGVEATRVLAHADVITPAKPDLGDINLAEAISWGQSHSPSSNQDSNSSGSTAKRRKGTAYDYAAISWELRSGADAVLMVSHSPFVRKGLAPEIELHGTNASLAVDRLRSTVSLFRPGDDKGEPEVVPDPGPVNRFSNYVFPGLRDRIEGKKTDHPGMDDGLAAQLFTDAAAKSAQIGTWVEVNEMVNL